MLRKIRDQIKMFHYKTITAIILLLILGVASYFFNIRFNNITKAILFSGLGVSLLVSFFVGARNLWVYDEDKAGAVLFFIGGLICVGLMVFVLTLI